MDTAKEDLLNMDDTPLDEYVSLLQSMTTSIDSHSRELQTAASFIKSLRIRLAPQKFDDIKVLILDAIKLSDDLDAKVMDAVKRLVRVIDKKERPSKPQPPGG